jgi:dihydroflavonol-4-reductase
MIAVTGANGLLGSFIVRKLIEQNRPFIAVVRDQSDTSLLKDVADKITWRKADVLDPVALEDAFADITHVVHAAAMVSFNPLLAKKIIDINTIGTRNVVNACLGSTIKRLVHISSVAALGRQKDQLVIDENNKWVDSPLNSVYAESKYRAELEVFRAQEEGLSTVILNPSVILAPADWYKSSAKLFKYVWDERPFYIDGMLNYVDVRDVANAAVHMIDSSDENTRFIMNGGSVTFLDFFTKVAQEFNKKVPGIQLRRNFLQAAAVVERLRATFTNSEPLITRETVRLAGTRFSYNSDKIKKTLNFNFQSIDNTIKWCCKHYTANFIGKK